MNRVEAIEAVLRVLEDPDRAGFDTYRAEAEAVVKAIWPPQPVLVTDETTAAGDFRLLMERKIDANEYVRRLDQRAALSSSREPGRRS